MAPSTNPPARPSVKRPPRLPEAVASELRLRIMNGELEGGEFPPAETLLEQFDASMPTLREALRILETEGLVTVRRGRHGGTVTTRPTPESAARHVGLLLQSTRTSIVDLAEARALLEPLCASMAAKRRQHVAIGKELAALNSKLDDSIDDVFAFTLLNGDFHAALVRGSGNQTMEIVVGVLVSVWSMHERGTARASIARDEYAPLAVRKAAIRAHARIADAIIKGDEEAAAEAALTHLRSTQKYITVESGYVNVLDPQGGLLT